MQGLGIKEQGLGKTMQAVRAISAMGAMAAALLLAGCRQDMQDQPKFIPQRGTTFFADGRSVRPQVANTVARNQMHENEYFYTGMVNGKEGDGFPIMLTPEVMQRGQERYNIYCTPCHSRVGNGYGAMPDYAAQLTPEDRWAVVAYIRALQLSQNAKPGDVAPGAKIEDLHQQAADLGMDPGLASPWGMPGTAIYGTPNGQDNGIPGQVLGPAAPGGAKISSAPGKLGSATPAASPQQKTK